MNIFRKKHKNQEESILSLIPKGWLVREISQDPVTGLWVGILFNINQAPNGGCLYVEAANLLSFDTLIDTLVSRIESGKGIKNTRNDH